MNLKTKKDLLFHFDEKLLLRRKQNIFFPEKNLEGLQICSYANDVDDDDDDDDDDCDDGDAVPENANFVRRVITGGDGGGLKVGTCVKTFFMILIVFLIPG